MTLALVMLAVRVAILNLIRAFVGATVVTALELDAAIAHRESVGGCHVSTGAMLHRSVDILVARSL